ncbi:methyl-accepting chemotaxis protein [Rhizobium lentis]|uniref:Uncharacterized protein n=1 Tax=Rhizobium lentis TaxID=1138194 RepID=A0A7W8XHR4_9HYPH|nr:methyl-accepting chemotaxis protein [Rhizobium lentis]MBB4576017.1 hypothetical protein [Rhizobium lentis]MBB5552326.1 hypothetical protein [Rhizobium lentis]MBB5563065.1 hypothetical protein [Rhizobium lentis]MBB5569143.1 hypothetical protein [Rhizobium lentis]
MFETLLQSGIATRDLVLELASLLKEPPAPGLFSLFLVLLLLVLVLAFFATVRSRAKALRSAINLVKKTNGASRLQEGFEDIQNRLAKQNGRAARHLADTWKEFRETTIEPRPGTALGVRNSIRPSVFFNLEDMGFSVSGWRFVPGFLVSIGLAATFLGLIAALQQTGESLKGGDQAQVREALTQLLSVASAKFIMSLTGLLCSIVFTAFLRVGGQRLESTMRKLTHEIEIRMNFISLEDLAERQLEAIVEQRDHMQKLNHDLIAAISKPLENALAASNTHVGTMVDDISRSLSTGLAAAMEKAGDRLENASDTLNGLATKISEAAEQFTVAAERTAVGLDGAARRLELVTDNLSRAGSGLADATEPMVEAITGTATTAKQIAEASVEMVQSARKALDSERGVVVAAAESIREQIKSFEARAASYDGQLEKAFKTFSTEIGRSVSEVENHANAVHQQYADALGTLQAVIENAKAFRPESERPAE